MACIRDFIAFAWCFSVLAPRTFADDVRLHRPKLRQTLDTQRRLCPSVGPHIFGDVRYDVGCHLSQSSHRLDSSRPIEVKPSHLDWLEQLSEQLINSTIMVNNFDQELNDTADNDQQQTSEQRASTGDGECSGQCIPSPPECCRVETRLAYPLYGKSMSTGRLVRIVQDADPSGIQQPVVYRQCLSRRTNLVHGRCYQSSLPRLLYVERDFHAGSTGYPFYQDLVLMPSNCNCILDLAKRGRHRGDEDGRQPITPPFEGSGSSAADTPDIDDNIVSIEIVSSDPARPADTDDGLVEGINDD